MSSAPGILIRNKAHTDWLASLQVGDVVTRWLAGTIPCKIKISAIDDLIHCGPWTFNPDNGCEIDEDLGWDGVIHTGSFIKKDE